MALVISTWVWGSKYPQHYVDRLRVGVARHLREPYRWAVFEPQPVDRHLTKIPGCFARLRMFDPHWQAENGIVEGDRIVCLDLDSIVTGSIDPLFYTAQSFMILLGANSANPCRMNGSIWMLRAGYRPDVWSDFSIEAAKKVPAYSFPDDQGWMESKMPKASGWNVGAESGIYAFCKPGWPKGDALPSGARLVVFPGHRDPSQFTNLDWVAEHWRS